MGKLHLIDHPLIQSKITLLRNKETGAKEFRELIKEVSSLICYEATRNLPVVDVNVETPLGIAKGKQIDKKITLAPILRAGMTMSEAVMQLLPTARIGHIGLYRDPDTLKPVEYYCKLPKDLKDSIVYILDPILATGGTSTAAIDFLKDRGVSVINIMSIIVCPEGINTLLSAHPDIDIYAGVCDDTLDENGYIVPGLGDAGDRLYGTK